MLNPKSTLLLLLLLLLLSACGATVAPPDIVPLDEENSKAAWAKVLAKHVDSQGRVDFAAVTAAPEDLQIWLAYVAQVSPHSYPERFTTKQDQLAYYIDAYNALALYGVIRSGLVPAQKLRFFLLRKYTIGGEKMSLYALENDVIRAFAEPRIHFALNCMSFSCPRLPQQPWSGEHLEQQLQAAAQEFFHSNRHLRVDDEKRILYLSELLDFFPEDFIALEPTLIAYVNRYRQPPIPADYQIEFIPYDWTLNAQ